MTEDHALADGLGARIEGRSRVGAGWDDYFRMVADYTITLGEAFSDGSVVVILGTAPQVQVCYCRKNDNLS